MTTVTRRHIVVATFVAGFLISVPAVLVSTQTQQLETPPVPPDTHFLDTQPMASPSIVRGGIDRAGQSLLGRASL